MIALTKKPSFSKAGTRVIQVFLDADLRSGHLGLTTLAKKNGLEISSLMNGQFIVFINRKKTMMKCFVAGNTISHTKRDRIDLNAIRYLPQAFGSNGEISYDAALEKSLRDRLEKGRAGDAQ